MNKLNPDNFEIIVSSSVDLVDECAIASEEFQAEDRPLDEILGENKDVCPGRND